MMPRYLGSLLCGFIVLSKVALAQEAAAASDLFSEPIPHDWKAPLYPPEALKAGVEGRITVTFVVDAAGQVLNPAIREKKEKPGDPRLNDAVLAAAKQWTFGPALDAGKPVPRAVNVTVGFYLRGRGNKPSVDLPSQPDPAPTRPAKAINQPDPDYPDELLPRKLPGEAEFEFEITPEGKVGSAKVLFASDVAFVTAGRATLNRWSFEPARQGPLPVASNKKSPMQFFVEGAEAKPEDVLAANGITGLTPSQADKAPIPLMMFAPVFPRARAVAGDGGEAEVEFVINEDGRTDYVRVVSASHPEFGAALTAAVETWQFRPATRSGTRVAVTLRVRHAFALKEGEGEQRVAKAWPAGIATAKGLDRPLAPIWRVGPRYPASLLAEKPAGEALVEFVIDRTGRARLPQATSASHEAFGWAAVTAISQWAFEPPLRNGEAVDVRVSIPVTFPAPAN